MKSIFTILIFVVSICPVLSPHARAERTSKKMLAKLVPGQNDKMLPTKLTPMDALNEKVVGLSAQFVFIPPGEFLMGSKPGEEARGNSETPQHKVKISKGFWAAKTEVTQLQYYLVLGYNPATFRNKEDCDPGSHMMLDGVSLCANHPIETITWNDDNRLIARLNAIQDEYDYRLPTEAEREYMSRGGKGSAQPYPFPAKDLPDYAWYSENAGGRTHAVARKKPGAFGLYDLNGNVCENAKDYLGYYSKEDQVDPRGPITGDFRISRGGSFHRQGQYLRSAYRAVATPDAPYFDVGLRLVRTPRKHFDKK